VAEGATALVSVGLAGGLDPALAPGAIIVPEYVADDGTRYSTDPALSAWLAGRPPAGGVCARPAVVATASGKAELWAKTGCAAVDLESGAVARAATRARLPFAVLRVVCDTAWRDLPPAALAALDASGAIAPARIVASLAARPGQIGGLLRLAMDAATARRALQRQLDALA
jgi:adenosylhomocysteine nucleosidase